MENESVEEKYTVKDYLFDQVNFDVPEGAVKSILKKRNVEETLVYPDECNDIKVGLLKADLLKWICLGPTKKGAVSDSDNGWSHSEGSYTLSKEDKKLLMNEANALYEENDEPESKFGRTKIRVRSLGIMGARYDLNGNPLPRIVK